MVKGTLFKIKKDAALRKSKHLYHHDEIVCRTIRQMRKFGMTMIDYDETVEPTIMRFEKKNQ